MVFPNVPFKLFDAVVQILQPVVWKESHIILAVFTAKFFFELLY